MPEIGWPELRVHPAHILETEDLRLLELWRAFRGEPQMALIPGPNGAVLPVETGRTAPLLPFAGGLAEQPACVIAAFRVMTQAADALKRE